MKISENFKNFQYFNFEADSLENENLFQKTGVPFFIRKNIFACLFSIHNTISLSCHQEVCLSGLRFER